MAGAVRHCTCFRDSSGVQSAKGRKDGARVEPNVADSETLFIISHIHGDLLHSTPYALDT